MTCIHLQQPSIIMVHFEKAAPPLNRRLWHQTALQCTVCVLLKKIIAVNDCIGFGLLELQLMALKHKNIWHIFLQFPWDCIGCFCLTNPDKVVNVFPAQNLHQWGCKSGSFCQTLVWKLWLCKSRTNLCSQPTSQKGSVQRKNIIETLVHVNLSFSLPLQLSNQIKKIYHLTGLISQPQKDAALAQSTKKLWCQKYYYISRTQEGPKSVHQRQLFWKKVL